MSLTNQPPFTSFLCRWKPPKSGNYCVSLTTGSYVIAIADVIWCFYFIGWISACSKLTSGYIRLKNMTVVGFCIIVLTGRRITSTNTVRVGLHSGNTVFVSLCIIRLWKLKTLGLSCKRFLLSRKKIHPSLGEDYLAKFLLITR